MTNKNVKSKELDLVPSIDEMQDWAKGKTARQKDQKLYQAQEKLFDALEKGDCSEAELKSLASKTLELCPLSTDAINMLALLASSDELRKVFYERAMEASRIMLGKKYFQETIGEFWWVIETRPYMRAMHGLAETLWDMSEYKESIKYFQEMLKLNPDDNQGVRYELAPKLIHEGRFEELGKLLESYDDDAQATWTYTNALYCFYKNGDCAKSKKLLEEAFQNNKHVPQYILGKKNLPKTLPPYMSYGSDDEAVICAYYCKDNWYIVPGAKEWLEKNVSC